LVGRLKVGKFIARTGVDIEA